MITPFMGEFLTSPFPLELAMHRCNYGCVYCFSTLNYRYSGYTQCNVASVLSLLQTFPDRKTLTAALLRQRYPVVMSNHTDPFCPANRALTVQLLPVFLELGIPVTFQTKGGVPEEVLDMLDTPVFWYVTITTDREDIRRRVEPGAPSIADRVKLIETLTQRGHVVGLGINPYVPEWWGDVAQAFRQYKAAGAHGVWIELLHLHYRQRDHMTVNERAALGEDLLRRAMKRKAAQSDIDAYFALWECADAAGLDINSGGRGLRSDYFTPAYDLYPQCFPIADQLINACHDADLDPIAFLTEDDFLDFFTPSLPSGKFSQMSSYLGATNHDLWWSRKVPSTCSYRELLSMVWRNPSVSFHPCRNGAFTMPVERLDQGDGREPQFVQYCDPEDAPLLSFQRPENFDHHTEFPREDFEAWYVARHPEAWQELMQEFPELRDLAASQPFDSARFPPSRPIPVTHPHAR